MFVQVLLAPLQTNVVDSVLLTVLHGLTVVAFLATGLATVHLLVRALRAERGRLRDRDVRLILVGAGVLFAAGFARLTVAGSVSHEGLAGVVLGFTAVTYLLYLDRPELFELSAQGETAGETDTESTN
jgi:hypothetical protein